MRRLRYCYILLCVVNALLIGVVVALFGLLWRAKNPFVLEQSLPEVAVMKVAPIENATDSSWGDPQAILDAGLFSRSLSGAELSAKSKPKAKPPKKPRVISHQDPVLRLCGTVADQGRQGLAIIEQGGDRQQNLYQVGDTVEDLRLAAIEQNRVTLIRNDGSLMTLELSLTDGVASTLNRRPSSPDSLKAEGRPEDVVRCLSNEVIFNRQASPQAVQRLNERLSEVVTQNTPEGIRVAGMADSALGRLLGLQDGDLIQSVNGHTLSNKRKASQVLRKARKLGKANINLLRDGTRKTLVFGGGSW